VNVRDYFTLLRESIFLIAGVVVASILIAGGVTMVLPKTYESTVIYYVEATGPVWGQPLAASESYSGAQLAQSRVKSYMEIATGPQVAENAARNLGDTTPAAVQSALSATTTADTVLFTVTTKAPTAERAVAVASAASYSFAQLVSRLETPTIAPDQVPLATVNPFTGPTAPTAPATPDLPVNLTIGLLLGLVLGFGAAIARRAMDSSIRSVESLQDATKAAVLGVVPNDKGVLSAPVVATARREPLRGEANARAEAYRRCRTALELAEITGKGRVLVVTSAVADEGKTLTACNLAAAFAAVGRRVVLVDADLRTPKVSEYLGLQAGPGLSEVLGEEAVGLAGALQRWDEGPIDVLTGGSVPAHPNELLASRRAGEIIAELGRRYDVVVIDTPPVVPVSDAANIGARTDGVLLVCRWGRTRGRDIASATEFLHSVAVPVLGTILSAVPSRLKWSAYGRPYGDRTRAVQKPEALGPDEPTPVENGAGTPST
jgi:capsular exopolysaccharide synthesis family protein